MLETNTFSPLVVEVTLYKHNLIDNRVLSEIRRNSRLQKVTGSNKHFFISTQDVIDVLETKFQDDILFQNGLNEEDLVQNVNSAFFLHSVVTTFPNLKYVKFSVSAAKNYTRKKGNQISFDYKILHAKIDLPALVESHKELKQIQKLLIALKFWRLDPFKPQTFIECSSRDIISQINYYEGEGEEFMQTHAEAIGNLMRYIDMKLETDNASLQVIVMN